MYTFTRPGVGNNLIFEPIINELRFLESDGIQILVEEKLVTVFFKLCLLIGDWVCGLV